MYQSGRRQFLVYSVLPTDSEPDGRQTAGVAKNWAGVLALSLMLKRHQNLLETGIGIGGGERGGHLGLTFFIDAS